MPRPGSHARPASDAERRAALERMDRLARLLDSALRVPGMRVTLGADAALNLVPALGPLASKAMSGWIIWQARRLGAPRSPVLHMAGIVALDAAVGAVPVVGWAADVVLRANRRCLDLLLAELASGQTTGAPMPAGALPAPAA